MMSISEMEEYLTKNKHIKQAIKSLNIVGGYQASHIGKIADGKRTYNEYQRHTRKVPLPKDMVKRLLNNLKQNKY